MEETASTLRFGDRVVRVFPASEPKAPLVLLNTFEGEGAEVRASVSALTEVPFSLAELSGLDWDRDLSPWPAPAVFRGEAPFGGGADAYLGTLTGTILPAVLAELAAPPAWLGLAGYSLAGLFALYAMYRTDLFSRIASASGSLWYPGFSEFVREHKPLRRPEKLYFSLGDREARTRNPVMRTVEDNTRALAQLYSDSGIDTVFSLNPGNHFQQESERMAKGVAWLLDGAGLQRPASNPL